MKLIITALGRLAVIGSAAFGLATIANYYNHKGYWDGTIRRVQTVDFNILANVLPTKLSYALQEGDHEEIQRTLNSNYGLFGLVVTDCTATIESCPNERILFATESYRVWDSGQPTLGDIAGQPYSLLKNPSPLTAENGYDHSWDTTWDATGRTNPGSVIGRIYYVRSNSPAFWDEYWGWIRQWPHSLLRDSGAAKYYALTVSIFMVSGAAVWSILELQRRLSEQAKAHTRNEAEQKIEKLNVELSSVPNLIHQLKQVQIEREDAEQRLVRESEQQQQQVAQLEHHIDALTKQLQQANAEEFHVYSQLELKSQSISTLQAQIAEQRHQQDAAENSLLDLQAKLVEVQSAEGETAEQLQKHEQQIIILKQEIEQQTSESQKRQEELAHLESKLDRLEQERGNLQNQLLQSEDLISKLQCLLDQHQQEKQEHLEALERAENGLHALRIENEQLTQQIQDLTAEKLALERYAEDLKTQNLSLKMIEGETLKRAKEEAVGKVQERLVFLSNEKNRLENHASNLQLKVDELLGSMDELQSLLCKAEEDLDRARNWKYGSREIDLTGLKVVIVGGHSSLHQSVGSELKAEYNLKKFEAIPTNREQHFDQKKVRDKTHNAHLVVVVTAYIGHGLSNTVTSLDEAGALRGQLLWINGPVGRTRLMRKILEHFAEPGRRSA